MTRCTPIVASVVAASLIAVTALGASAGGPSDPIVLKTAPSGTTLELVDGTAAEGDIDIMWVEEDGAGRDLSGAGSEDAGSTWSLPGLIFQNMQAPRADRCGVGAGYPFAIAVSLLFSGERGVRFAWPIHHEVFGPGLTYTRPDVACVAGIRHFGVALRTESGSTRLKLYSRDVSAAPVDVELDLGPANKGSTPAVAAAAGRLYVAWTHGTRLRFKRFTIGDGPGHPLTGSPTVTLEDTTSQSSPRMAADGKRVVLAWERKGSVVARVSTDKGQTFRARRVVFGGDPGSGTVAFVTDVDALGPTLIVSGAVSSEGISVRSGVRRTTDGGTTWAKVGPERTGGFLIGILGGTGADPRLHLVWDERFREDPQEIRVQYLDLG